MEIRNANAYGPSETLAPLRRPRRAPYELFERGIRDFPSPGIAGDSAEVTREEIRKLSPWPARGRLGGGDGVDPR